MANEEAIRRALRIVWEAEHRIDALIYSAGFSMSAPLEDVDLSDVYYLFQVNLFGLLTFMKYLIPLCKIKAEEESSPSVRLLRFFRYHMMLTIRLPKQL